MEGGGIRGDEGGQRFSREGKICRSEKNPSNEPVGFYKFNYFLSDQHISNIKKMAGREDCWILNK